MSLATLEGWSSRGTSTPDLVKSSASLSPVVRGVVKEVVGHQPSSKTSVWSEGRRKRIVLAEWPPGVYRVREGFGLRRKSRRVHGVVRVSDPR